MNVMEPVSLLTRLTMHIGFWVSSETNMFHELLITRENINIKLKAAPVSRLSCSTEPYSSVFSMSFNYLQKEGLFAATDTWKYFQTVFGVH